MERALRTHAHQDMKCVVEEPGDADEDAFLDRMTGLLDAIVRECAAVGRTEDGGAVLAKAASAFEGVQRMCREAGIVHANAAREASQPGKAHSSNAASRVVPLKAHDFKKHASPPRSPGFPIDDQLSHSLNLDLHDERSVEDDQSLPPSTPVRCRLPMGTGDDIIEVEITDILTSTQEEIQRWKHEFRLQMMEQEARQHDQNRAHFEQIQALRETLDESQRYISKLHKDINDTTTKLDSMQALTTKSQKAMELTLKEHTQYWKAICNDLVVEKRTIAKKLAEERGKYHSLREHIDMHDSNGSSSKTAPELRRSSPPPSPVKAKRTATSSLLSNHASASSGSSRLREGSMVSSMYALESSSPPTSSFRRYYINRKPSS